MQEMDAISYLSNSIYKIQLIIVTFKLPYDQPEVIV